MPRRTHCVNDEPTQNALSREQMATGPHARGGAANNTSNHSNEGIEAFFGNSSSSTPNSNTITLDTSTESTPLSSQTALLPQSSSPQRQPSAAPHYGQTRPKLDTSLGDKQNRKDLLREAFLPDWEDDAASADLGSPDEMQKKDPLGTQIWKYYSKIKSQLPNQERMENITWRMMAIELNKRKEKEQARYAHTAPLTSQVELTHTMSRASQQHSHSNASGIAKLRQSVDPSINPPDPDAMNIDDLIFPTSIESPAGMSTSPTPPLHSTASAIPIQTRKDPQDPAHLSFLPSAPTHDGMRNREFDYVQRRVRKTSIDETKVGSSSM